MYEPVVDGLMDTDFLYLFPGFLCVAWSVRNSSHCCQYSLNSDINNTSGSHTQKELPRNIKTKLSWASKYFYLTFGRGGGEPWGDISSHVSRGKSGDLILLENLETEAENRKKPVVTNYDFPFICIFYYPARSESSAVSCIYILLHKISVLALIYRIVLFWPL